MDSSSSQVNRGSCLMVTWPDFTTVAVVIFPPSSIIQCLGLLPPPLLSYTAEVVCSRQGRCMSAVQCKWAYPGMLWQSLWAACCLPGPSPVACCNSSFKAKQSCVLTVHWFINLFRFLLTNLLSRVDPTDGALPMEKRVTCMWLLIKFELCISAGPGLGTCSINIDLSCQKVLLFASDSSFILYPSKRPVTKTRDGVGTNWSFLFILLKKWNLFINICIW